MLLASEDIKQKQNERTKSGPPPPPPDERQAQSMMPKIERYTDTLKQAQRQKV